jgi:hypothetical protein
LIEIIPERAHNCFAVGRKDKGRRHYLTFMRWPSPRYLAGAPGQRPRHRR